MYVHNMVIVTKDIKRFTHCATIEFRNNAKKGGRLLLIPSREGNNYISKREAKRNPKFRTKFRTEAKILSPPELREHLTEKPSTVLNSAHLGLEEGGGQKSILFT